MQTGPLFVSSGDLVADRRYKWALDYFAEGDLAAAIEVLEQVVESVPGFATAWFALGAIRDRQGDRDGAIAAFRKAGDADREDYHGARLHLARLGAGEVAPAMTQVYVRRLFDQHAPEFDQSLTGKLDYRGPALLFAAVHRVTEAAARPLRFGAMLDLGCGTGLAAVPFQPVVGRLVGVDLSSRMVDEARKKALYDRLEAAEVTEFLASEAAADAKYDLVLAADVFVYMSDLNAVATAVRSVFMPSGLFAFTVETHDGDGVLLRETLRYAHGAAHVRGAVAAAGLNLLHLEDAAIRTEKNAPVPALVVVAQSPGTKAP